MATPTPKSILKKTPVPSTIPSDVVAINPGPRATTGTKPTPTEARAIALSHAHALQIRKALELSILMSLEELVDYPTPVPSTSEASTTHHNSPALKLHLRYFQPSDYDSLIHERNILKLCGYPLCSEPKKSKATSNHVLIDKGLSTMRFVPRAKLERFCSDLCARCGLWLRVQLNDEPSWLRGDVLEGVEVGEKGEVIGLDLEGVKWRANGGEETMVLLEEVERRKEMGIRSAVKEGDLKKLVQELEGLGIEIDGKEIPTKQEPLAFTIEEKEVSGSAVAPSADDLAAGMSALAIEGYKPRKGPEDYLPKSKKP
ncbi:Rtr1/RPAP2 family-domain-containing protein [Morchella snyderi]|nr:Rtr1/RPAP2 family-domain-containing protein [Morchella snyderi]